MKLLIPALLVALVLYTYVQNRQRGSGSLKRPHKASNTPSLATTLTLHEAVQQPDWQQRLTAVQKLTEQEARENLSLLLPLLDDPDPDVREMTKRVIIRAGTSAQAALIDILQKGRLNARWAAAESLGELRADGAATALSAAVAGDESMWVRGAAAEALGKIGGDTARAALQAALSDDEAEVRQRAEQALYGIRR